MEFSVCGNYWIKIPNLVFANSHHERIMMAHPHPNKQATIEDQKEFLFTKEPQVEIPPDANQAKKDKILKDFEKKCQGQEALLKQTVLQKGHFLIIQGDNFPERNCWVRMEIEEEQFTKEWQAFVRNEKEIVFEVPELSRDEFTIKEVEFSYSFNQVQY